MALKRNLTTQMLKRCDDDMYSCMVGKSQSTSRLKGLVNIEGIASCRDVFLFMSVQFVSIYCKDKDNCITFWLRDVM